MRFARNADDLRVAYAVSGRGYPLVRAATWMSHVELDRRTAILGSLFDALAARFMLYRYDARGYGLSEGSDAQISLDTLVADLEAVVDEAKLDRFALWGSTTAGAITALAYCTRHAERVSHLVLSAPVARGALRRPGAKPEEIERFLAFAKLVEHGWGEENAAFRQLQTMQMFPEAPPGQRDELNELIRASAAPDHAARMVMATARADVSDQLPRIACPVLVLHCRRAALMPIDEARVVASSIRDARFVSLDCANYVPLRGEPAFTRFIEELDGFLPHAVIPDSRSASLAGLTRRELQVLDCVARGMDNQAIGSTLDVSEKTVRNTVSHIFDKLGVHSRAQAAIFALKAGLGV